MNNLVICGDSFNIGIGCHNLEKEPYGSLLSDKLNLNLINLAKGSSSNFSIFLQVKYAIENYKNIDLMCIGVTTYNRTEWFPENYEFNGDIKNTNVNYHQYPPFGKDSYKYNIPNPMQLDGDYNGKLLTENFNSIIDYVDNCMDNPNWKSNYYSRFDTESKTRMKLLKEYYLEIFDDNIQRQYDIGMMNLAHSLLKNKGIKHIFLTYDLVEFNKYIPMKNLANVDFMKLSHQYPDDMNTMHTSNIGHEIVYKIILDKLKNNDYI
jgi:hypothetical protein